MGTIDISYLSLGIGLLLLSIPLFYIWKFKTGLLRATLIGTARMIVQLFFIGIYLKYLFLWNNPVGNRHDTRSFANGTGAHTTEAQDTAATYIRRFPM